MLRDSEFIGSNQRLQRSSQLDDWFVPGKLSCLNKKCSKLKNGSTIDWLVVYFPLSELLIFVYDMGTNWNSRTTYFSNQINILQNNYAMSNAWRIALQPILLNEMRLTAVIIKLLVNFLKLKDTGWDTFFKTGPLKFFEKNCWKISVYWLLSMDHGNYYIEYHNSLFTFAQ